MFSWKTFIDKAIKIHKNNSKILYNYAIQLLEDKQGTKAENVVLAIKTLNSAIKAEKNFFLALYTLAEVYRTKEDSGSKSIRMTMSFLYYQKAVEASKTLNIDVLHPDSKICLANAYHALGVRYYNGWGTPVNKIKALECYKTSAGLGMGEAKMLAGDMLSNGENITMRNIPEAIKYFREAADQGIEQAKIILNNFETRILNPNVLDVESAKAKYEALANKNNANAACQLAVAYLKEGREKEGISWLRIAKKNGSIEAEVILGEFLPEEKIKDPTERLTKQLRMFEAAAIFDSSEAQYYCAHIYEQLGDQKKAIEWLKKAHKNGYKEATEKLASFYILGKGVEKNISAAIHCLLEGKLLVAIEEDNFEESEISTSSTSSSCIATTITSQPNQMASASSTNFKGQNEEKVMITTTVPVASVKQKENRTYYYRLEKLLEKASALRRHFREFNVSEAVNELDKIINVKLEDMYNLYNGSTKNKYKTLDHNCQQLVEELKGLENELAQLSENLRAKKPPAKVKSIAKKIASTVTTPAVQKKLANPLLKVMQKETWELRRAIKNSNPDRNAYKEKAIIALESELTTLQQVVAAIRTVTLTADNIVVVNYAVFNCMATINQLLVVFKRLEGCQSLYDKVSLKLRDYSYHCRKLGSCDGADLTPEHIAETHAFLTLAEDMHRCLSSRLSYIKNSTPLDVTIPHFSTLDSKTLTNIRNANIEKSDSALQAEREKMILHSVDELALPILLKENAIALAFVRYGACLNQVKNEYPELYLKRKTEYQRLRKLANMMRHPKEFVNWKNLPDFQQILMGRAKMMSATTVAEDKSVWRGTMGASVSHFAETTGQMTFRRPSTSSSSSSSTSISVGWAKPQMDL